VTNKQFVTWMYRAKGFDRTDDNAIAPAPATAPSVQYLDYLQRQRPNGNPKPLRDVQPSKQEIVVKIEETHKQWNANSAGTRTFKELDTTLPHAELLQDAYETVLYEYYKADEIDAAMKQKMIDGAVKGMVEALDDDYSTYMPAMKAQEFRRQVLDGDFQGIGAYIFNDDGVLRIVEPIEGSPAQKAGLLTGDALVEVDGENIESEPLEIAVEKIKGPAGTDVTLLVDRDGEEVEIVVTRGKIDVPTITLKWTESGIPVLRVHTFNTRTGNDFIRTLRTDVLPEDPEAILFDFRNNTGGILDAAYDVGGAFIPNGQQAVVMNMLTKDGVAPRNTIGSGLLSDYEGEMVVLQNKYTASASEVVIAMLRDRELVTIVGEKSFGKGSAQRTHTLQGGGLLKVTFTLWASPDGDPINENGVEPDIAVESQRMDQVQGVDNDAMVRRALEYLAE
jgi:carboxyl-terminal processing protease